MKPGTKTINIIPAAQGAKAASVDPARIVKVSLVSNVVGASAPAPGAVAEQQLSIEATGRAKFDAYTLGAGGAYERLCHCKFAIGADAAQAAIAAVVALTQADLGTVAADTGAWHLKLTDDAGHKRKFDGPLGAEAAAQASQVIRSAIALPHVLAFDAE